MRLKKWDGNPILKPNPKNEWEKLAVLNPGAYYHDGKVYLLYRACGETVDYVIYMGLAESTDGFHFERVSDEPVLPPSEDGFDAGCVEDARIVRLGEWFYVTYAARAFPPCAFWAGKRRKSIPAETPTWTRNWTRTGLARSKDLRTFERLGPITGDDVDDRDVIIFPEKVNGRYVMLRRPQQWVGEEYGTDVPGIWIAWSDDLLHWEDNELIATARFPWEGQKVGGSTPPIKTDDGWLMLYHGVGGDTYRVGVMMLDREDPRRIIARAPDFIMEPEAEFEKEGIVKNVVFPCGNVVIGDEIFVYYGGADTVCCVATAKLRDLVEYVMKHRR